MSIKKSQEFLYFQNKARHYQNIRSARPCINDKLQKQYRHTIDYSPKNKGHQSYMQMYNIQVGNEHLINRLVNITKSKRTEVSAQGDYSRYNSIERSFRKRNPHKDETQRKILLQNQEIVNRLDQAKPAIGSTSEWYTQYQRKLSHRKNISRYDDTQRSKGSLHISTSRFLPEHYKSYIFKLDGSGVDDKVEAVKVISKQKLMKLPRILNSQRSSSVLQSNKSQSDLLDL